ncbi:MAG: hypothetical protein HFF84_08325 [Oscillibacter sp.]|nr:hypothetical protein [Oscillibacter sp.]
MDDYMEEFLKQLRGLLADYGAFCRIAEGLTWQDAEERHEDWFRTYPLGIRLDAYEFPRGYIILHHAAEAYVQSVLSGMAHAEEWEPGFWDIPPAERTCCLAQGKKLYQAYAIFREVRLIKRDWAYLAEEIQFFANVNKIPVSQQKRYLDRFENAKVIELGGSDGGDAVYWAVKRSALLVVSCGCWD